MGDLGGAEPGWRGIGAGVVAVPRTWTSASAPALMTQKRSGNAGSWGWPPGTEPPRAGPSSRRVELQCLDG